MDMPEKTIECNLYALENYNFPLNEPFKLIVKINNLSYELIINLNEYSDKLLIIGSNPTNKSPYENLDWYFEESTIYYNDPTAGLSEKITKGWAIGTANNWCLKDLASIVKKIAGNLFEYDVKNQYNNLIFYGHSMSGFMSIALSTLIKNSTSLVQRPMLKAPVANNDAFLNLLFNGLSKKDILSKYIHRFNIIDLIKKENYIPNCYMIIDNKLNSKLASQYNTFFNELKKSNINNSDENNFNIKYQYIDDYKPLKSFEVNNILENINKINNKDFFDYSTVTKERLQKQKEKIDAYEKELEEQIKQISTNNKELAQNEIDIKNLFKEFNDNNQKMDSYINKINDLNNKIKENDTLIKEYQSKIENLENEINLNENKTEDYKNNQEKLIDKLSKQVDYYQDEVISANNSLNNALDKLQSANKKLKNTINSKNSINKQIKYDEVTIEYYKLKGSLKKKALLWIPYLYLLVKSSPKRETLTNIRLYRRLNNSTWFDIGYYLVKNPDLNRNKWCKYLTPELHYVLYGFNEKRKSNNGYKNNLTKKELIKSLK